MNWRKHGNIVAAAYSRLDHNSSFKMWQMVLIFCLAPWLMTPGLGAAQESPRSVIASSDAQSGSIVKDTPIAEPLTQIIAGHLPELDYAARMDPIEAVAPRTNFIMIKRPISQPRTFDRAFVILAAVSAATAVADIELTANCLKTVVNCREGNPFMGSDPSRARLYGMNIPFYVGEIVLSRMLRRRFPERKTWTMPLLSATGMHAVGISSNMRAR